MHNYAVPSIGPLGEGTEYEERVSQPIMTASQIPMRLTQGSICCMGWGFVDGTWHPDSRLG